MADIDAGKELEYTVKFKGNGVYVMLVEGEVQVGGHLLTKRDAIGISETEKFSIKANVNSEVLLIEVPMN